MKATLDIPDSLYRQVKARSALEGRRVREVAIELFYGWVEGPQSQEGQDPHPLAATPSSHPGWFGAFRKYAIHARNRHDLDSVRESIARGRAKKKQK